MPITFFFGLLVPFLFVLVVQVAKRGVIHLRAKRWEERLRKELRFGQFYANNATPPDYVWIGHIEPSHRKPTMRLPTGLVCRFVLLFPLPEDGEPVDKRAKLFDIDAKTYEACSHYTMQRLPIEMMLEEFTRVDDARVRPRPRRRIVHVST